MFGDFLFVGRGELALAQLLHVPQGLLVEIVSILVHEDFAAGDPQLEGLDLKLMLYLIVEGVLEFELKVQNLQLPIQAGL